MDAAQGELAQARLRERDSGTELRELLDSQAYQDAVAAAGRVESLRADLAGRQDQRDAADRRAERAASALRAARTAVEAARAQVAAAEAEAERRADDLARAAEPAGLVVSAERHLPGRDVDALAADHQVRTERFGRLRRLHEEHATRDRAANSSGEALQQAETARTRARDDEVEAADGVGTAAGDLELRLRDWAAEASVAAPPPELLQEWCALVPGLTVVDPDDGSVRPGPSVVDTARQHVSAARDRVADRLAQARSVRPPLTERLAELDAALAEVLAGVQGEPAVPASWRRRDRPAPDAGRGAPLWRLVNPAGVGGGQLDLLEAALAASGLLDAWVSPDGTLDREGGRLVADVQPQPRAGRPAEASLLAVLDPDPSGGVPVEVVRRLLAGVGWSPAHADADAGDCLAADGSWRIGGLTGRAEPSAPASFLGAAAREAARERERARLEVERAMTTQRIAVLDREIAAASADLERVAAEERALPAAAERALGQAVVRLAERGRARAAAEQRVREAQRRHADDLERRDRAWADFADHAGAHRFALTDLPGQEEALRRFGEAVTRLDSELRLLAARLEHADEATSRLDERAEAAAAAAVEATEAAEALRTASVRLSAAEENLGEDQRERLDRRAALDAEIERLRELMAGLEVRLRTAEVAAATALAVLERHEESRRAAEKARDDSVHALWVAVDAGFAEALGLQAPERRTVQSAREFTAAVRRELDLQADEARQEQAWRTCFRELESLRQHLLPTRDAHVRDEDDMPAEGGAPARRGARRPGDRLAAPRPGCRHARRTGAGAARELRHRAAEGADHAARVNVHRAPQGPARLHDTDVRADQRPAVAAPDPARTPGAGALRGGPDRPGGGRRGRGAGAGVRGADRRPAADGAVVPGAEDRRGEGRGDGRRYRGLEGRAGAGAGLPAVAQAVAAVPARRGQPVGGVRRGAPRGQVGRREGGAAVAAAVRGGGRGVRRRRAVAPRWVWLDEAMTGVDAAVKASFMGLTVEFDLDVMLTAHDEWCDYVTVPAVAVFDLARHEHLPGVDAVPYLWCGGSMTAVDVERIGVAADDGGIPAEGLFADLDEA